MVYAEITSEDDLPVGIGDDQSPGHYGLVSRGDRRVFDYTVGPLSPKRWTFPPIVALNVGRRDGRAVSFEAAPIDPPKLAFFGVRACELAALGIQDRVFLGGPYTDEDYRARRRNALVVAVNCTTSASTCFCTSMGTGPEVRGGYDLALTELDEGFVVRAGTPEGADLIARLPLRGADAGQMFRAAEEVGKVAATIGDPVPTAGLHDRLLAQFDSPQWAKVAERCLSCANCTMVCPTCFCSSVTQRSDLDGGVSTSDRVWDFCFTAGFAKVAGGNFRSRPRDRYRQWLTHKFATWVDQFGTFGCVGCGRCIAWCPVGIDIREELLAVAPPLAARPEPARPQPIAATPGSYATARIVSVRSETEDVTTLTVGDVDSAFLAGEFGQFAMVAVPAFPPLPISISRFGRDTIDLTIRAAGPATAALIGMGSARRDRPARSARHVLADRAGHGPRRGHRHRRHRPGAAAAAHRRACSPSATTSMPSGSTTARGPPTTSSTARSFAPGPPAATWTSSSSWIARGPAGPGLSASSPTCSTRQPGTVGARSRSCAARSG